ncbi:CDP-alcohol phosphatidyltransferase family protein [Arthrobacter sp. NQ7]|uniref:Phosphatidylserine synthase n=1 Tax=Pseudarthrobacter enclensis TaxID=993070 RepID=A0ABT9RZ87_9MICC|nr:MULTISPECIES: CDP-alcohol phosphatidyltransferase family protein [Micrococcaceae]MDJ0457984.1 CDP-alcohol phosphatidyltransferase family protein [Arthrobacter sp. NQ7]MDP9890126.1 phosphatidylserine synthase [Pseudarthrobacter enclensis]
MFDALLRHHTGPVLDRMASAADRTWVTPDRLTGLNLVLGLASAGLAAAQWWLPALAAWLLSRLADGLDGPLARLRRHRSGQEDPGRGGFWDISADFVVYGATVVGVALGATSAFAAPWLPFLLVLFAYYINGAVFLAFSSIAEKTGRQLDDGRSLSFLGGLAEGAETIVVHSVWLIFPGIAWLTASVWAVLVGVSAAHRILAGYRALS